MLSASDEMGELDALIVCGSVAGDFMLVTCATRRNTSRYTSVLRRFYPRPRRLLIFRSDSRGVYHLPVRASQL